MHNKNFIPLFLIFLAIVVLILSAYFENPHKINNIQKNIPQQKQNISKIQDEIISIPINQPTELSYKLKENIYKLRIAYVKDSIFNKPNYTPSDEIFGNIVSGKPWIASDVCTNWQTKASKIDGPSEEARFINNPALLVAIEYPFTFSNYEDISWCKSPTINMIPKNITYNKTKNEISITYEKLPFSTLDNKSFYTFNGLNARDLGYKYAYIDKKKSTYHIDFIDNYNIANEIIEFQNFIHLGSSCKVPGGCNNGSPRQTYLEFKNDKNDNYETQNGIIYIKLWKHIPKSPSAKPDIVEKIILEKI